MKFSLQRFIDTAQSNTLAALCLLNRRLNRRTFLCRLKEAMLEKSLKLREFSLVFMKLNQVYKQAGIERQTLRKKSEKKSALEEEELDPVENLVQQQQRLGRLQPNTSFNATSLNTLLTESAPTNRVLSGESIIFQNEVHEIFKELTDEAADARVDYRFLVAVLLEFMRALLEHKIPVQPSIQALVLKFLLRKRDTTQLHKLLQYHVLSKSLELGRILIFVGSEPQSQARRVLEQKILEGRKEAEVFRNIVQSVPQDLYYEAGFQLGMDILYHERHYAEVVDALIVQGHLMKALDFALSNKVHSIPTLPIVHQVQLLKDQGMTERANQLLMRLQEIKAYDNHMRQLDPSFRVILLDS